MQIVETIYTVIITTIFTAGVINFGLVGRIGVRNAQVEKQARDVLVRHAVRELIYVQLRLLLGVQAVNVYKTMYVKIVPQENTKQIHGKVAISVSHVLLAKHHQQARTKQAIATLVHAQQESTAMAAIVLIVQLGNTKQIHGHLIGIANHVRRVKHHRQAPPVQIIAISTNVMQERIFLARAVKIAQQAHTKQIPRQLSRIANHVRRVKHHCQEPHHRILASLVIAQQERTATGIIV